MFIRDCWYVAAWAHDIAPGEPYPITIIGQPVVIYRPASGGYAALEDRCVHRLAPLSRGRCEGDFLRCMYHGLVFDSTGHCVEIPGQESIPEKARVRTYPVEERDSWLWIWMGAADRADLALIPKSHGLDDPDWRLMTGHLDYDANYQLISDNLTDFSHLSFVHAESFNAGLNWALSRPNITTLDRGINVERWVENDPVPPYLYGRGLDSVDQYINYDYLVPGILLLSTEVHAGGTSAGVYDQRPTPLFATFSGQAVTPIDEHRSRYFFSWGPRRTDGDADTATLMMEVARQAFAEDKDIIEAQQKVIDLDPSRPPMPVAADKGVTLFQRLMGRLLRAESTHEAAL